MIITNVAQLRAQLESALVGELGEYSRPPPLPNIPAVFVGDRLTPTMYKVLTRPITADPIPSIELVIQSRPAVSSRGRNFNQGHRSISEVWQIWLVFHDSRQDPRQATRSILSLFPTAGSWTYLPSSDGHAEQYTIEIDRKTQIKVNK